LADAMTCQGKSGLAKKKKKPIGMAFSLPEEVE